MKPQRKVLTLFEKTEIIKHLESGMSVTCASKKYKIAKSTVCALKKNKTNILNVAAKCVGSTHKRKTLKRSEMPILEKKLYRWFCNLRRKNIRVSTFMIKKKAKAMHEELKEKMNFTASDGWLQNFKKRFGIRFLKISGEELSSTPESVDQFKNELSLTLKTLGLTAHQIYNAAETGLFWKLLPNKTLVTCNEKRAPGRKVEKPRITFLACINATGEHKIKPLVIGKARNPRCFKNYPLPVDYDYSKSAWMTAAIFSNWFHKSFVPQVRRFLEQRKLPAKAILILDNVPSHPPVEDLRTNDGNIVTIYMPPNVTPMCQNVIQLTKLIYRSNLLSLVVSRNSNQIAKSIKELNLKDAVINLSLAWDKVEPDVIKKCWENILIPAENDSDSKEDIPLEALREGYKSAAVEECMEDTGTSLNEIQPKAEFSVEEVKTSNNEDETLALESEDIKLPLESGDEMLPLESEDIKLPLESGDDDVEEEEGYDENSLCQRVTSVEAAEAFDKILLWSDGNIFNIDDILTLRKCRNIAVIKSLEEKNRQN